MVLVHVLPLRGGCVNVLPLVTTTLLVQTILASTLAVAAMAVAFYYLGRR